MQAKGTSTDLLSVHDKPSPLQSLRPQQLQLAWWQYRTFSNDSRKRKVILGLMALRLREK